MGNRRFGVVLALAGSLLAAASATGDTTTRVSVDSSNVEGNGAAGDPAISADGRYVAFASAATNLVPGDTNSHFDVFVRDRQLGATTRVSVDSSGTEGNGDSGDNPSISADGRYVVFLSDATNLVPGDSNAQFDAFVHDRQLGTTQRASVDSAGLEANAGTTDVSISPDGRYIAFASDADNLVTGDVNGASDVFVHDSQTGQTTRVSVASTGTEGNGSSLDPWISVNGRYVAFTSDASNLVPGDSNGTLDVFVHDRQTGQTEMVSVSSGGSPGNDESRDPSISPDGRYIAFTSDATNFVAGAPVNGAGVFVRDVVAGQTTLVSVDSGGAPGNGESKGPSISADGRRVAFRSEAANLVAGDTNSRVDIFVHDRVTGQTTRASLDTNGIEADGDSDDPSLTADGLQVVFSSGASNLVPGDSNGVDDVFVRGPHPVPTLGLAGLVVLCSLLACASVHGRRFAGVAG